MHNSKKHVLSCIFQRQVSVAEAAGTWHWIMHDKNILFMCICWFITRYKYSLMHVYGTYMYKMYINCWTICYLQINWLGHYRVWCMNFVLTQHHFTPVHRKAESNSFSFYLNIMRIYKYIILLILYEVNNWSAVILSNPSMKPLIIISVKLFQIN
jgi:hypothetical protein